MKRNPRRTGLPALVGLLLVVFVIAGLLVYEAWNTGRSRREIAERGLQDYAAYATWSTARTGEGVLLASLSTIFRNVAGNRVAPGSPLAPIPEIVSGAAYLRQCDCAMNIPALYYFRFDRRSVSLQTALDNPDVAQPRTDVGWASAKVGSFTPTPAKRQAPDESEWLKVVLAQLSGRPIYNFGLLLAPHGDSIRAIGVAPQRDSAGEVVGVFGFVASAPAFAAATFNSLWRNPKLLPYAITRGMPNDSLLAAVVTTSTGVEVYRSRQWTEGLRSDTASFGSVGGNMKVRVALRGDAIARLQGGIVPASRVPVWVGLLMLTGMLTVVIIRNIQREHELARLRLEFSASVSHELRTPLAQILLFGETLTLGRTRSDGERANAASVIVREARRLMHLVDNSLTFSRAERPTVSLSPRRVTIAPIVRDVISGFEPLASARDVIITSRLNELAETFVDSEALGQMVLNLLDNAVKYGPTGQRVIVELTRGHFAARTPATIARKGKTDPRPTVRLSVEDEGPGVEGGAREDIWVAFARGVNGEPAIGTGCGLGLAVVRELTERHSGTAWVEPAAAGSGSRFVIELPDALTKHILDPRDDDLETTPSAAIA